MSFQGVAPIRFESVSNVTASLGVNSPELGTKCTFDGDEYVFVHNAGNSEIPPNYMATVSAVSGYSVTLSSVAGGDIAIGVCQHATITTGAYGWLLCRGFANVKNGMASTALAAGADFILGGDGTVVNPTATNAVEQIIGKVMAATGSAGTAGAYVKLYG